MEKLLYRGVLCRYLRGHGVRFAAIGSSVIFGLVHMNFLQLIFAAFLGVVSVIAAAVYLVRQGLKTDITPENKKNCLYFFTSVPMVIFTLACLGICVG